MMFLYQNEIQAHLKEKMAKTHSGGPMEQIELIKLLLESLRLSNDTLNAFADINATHGDVLVMLKKLITSNAKLIEIVEEQL